jgi:hypothetical protein
MGTCSGRSVRVQGGQAEPVLPEEEGPAAFRRSHSNCTSLTSFLLRLASAFSHVCCHNATSKNILPAYFELIRPGWLRGGESFSSKPQPEIYRRLGLKVPWEGPGGGRHRTAESGQVGTCLQQLPCVVKGCMPLVQCCAQQCSQLLQLWAMSHACTSTPALITCMATAAHTPLSPCGCP